MLTKIKNTFDERYCLKEILDESSLNSHKNVYIYAFYKEYNYHRVNSKIMDIKGAFGNLGFVVNKKNLEKNILTLNSEKIYFDILKVDKETDLKLAIYNSRFESYMGLFYGDKDKVIDKISKELKKIIIKYFEFDNQDKDKFEILIKYFNTIHSFDYKTAILLSNLRGQLKLIEVENKKKKTKENYSLLIEDIIYLPFLKKYSDYLNRKNLVLKK
ncbi:hypothetical protein [Tenacibaculum maritimum]|uniref:hypothetical protein n=1 Tax=Tenacibaculum maritimum TaxID=107401 RepID=UPI0012E43CDA|nr:hypothetical protein [Tenacibaculum maritimum]CAA0177243.1 hypothetical protein FS0810_150030 [Tenacibaculum maritimum]